MFHKLWNRPEFHNEINEEVRRRPAGAAAFDPVGKLADAIVGPEPALPTIEASRNRTPPQQL